MNFNTSKKPQSLTEIDILLKVFTTSGKVEPTEQSAVLKQKFPWLIYPLAETLLTINMGSLLFNEDMQPPPTKKKKKKGKKKKSL